MIREGSKAQIIKTTNNVVEYTYTLYGEMFCSYNSVPTGHGYVTATSTTIICELVDRTKNFSLNTLYIEDDESYYVTLFLNKDSEAQESEKIIKLYSIGQ